MARAYEYAISEKPTLEDATDDELYDWLEDHGPEQLELPDNRDTFKRYMRMARESHGDQKKTSRHGRSTGRSIVRQGDREPHSAD